MSAGDRECGGGRGHNRVIRTVTRECTAQECTAGTLAMALRVLLLALPWRYEQKGLVATKNILFFPVLCRNRNLWFTYEGTTWSLVAEFSLTPTPLASPTGFLLLLSQTLKKVTGLLSSTPLVGVHGISGVRGGKHATLLIYH